MIGAQTAGNNELFTLHKDEQENKLISIIDITNRDTLACNRAADNREITNAFDNIKNALPVVLENTFKSAATVLAEYKDEGTHYLSFVFIPDYDDPKSGKSGGQGIIAFDEPRNGGDKHDVYGSACLEVTKGEFDDWSEPLDTIENDGEVIFPFTVYYTRIYEALNSKVDSN